MCDVPSTLLQQTEKLKHRGSRQVFPAHYPAPSRCSKGSSLSGFASPSAILSLGLPLSDPVLTLHDLYFKLWVPVGCNYQLPTPSFCPLAYL